MSWSFIVIHGMHVMYHNSSTPIEPPTYNPRRLYLNQGGGALGPAVERGLRRRLNYPNHLSYLAIYLSSFSHSTLSFRFIYFHKLSWCNRLPYLFDHLARSFRSPLPYLKLLHDAWLTELCKKRLWVAKCYLNRLIVISC